jgi:hypothetical protein
LVLHLHEIKVNVSFCVICVSNIVSHSALRLHSSRSSYVRVNELAKFFAMFTFSLLWKGVADLFCLRACFTKGRLFTFR